MAYEIWKFSAAFTRVPQSPSWAESTQFLVLIPNSLRSILILSSYLCLGLPKGVFPTGVHSSLKDALFCTIICIIFTSLCKKLVKLTWVFSRSFSMPCASFSMVDVKHWELCTWHRKASAKNSSKFNKFLAKWSENNTYYTARWRWTKQQHP